MRISVYGAMLLNCLFAQYVSPFHYLCDIEGYSCAFCGMRHAVDLLLCGRFAAAVESNRLIVVLLVLFGAAAVDTLFIFRRWIQKKKGQA